MTGFNSILKEKHKYLHKKFLYKRTYLGHRKLRLITTKCLLMKLIICLKLMKDKTIKKRFPVVNERRCNFCRCFFKDRETGTNKH